jgi:hypothetical protein
VGILALFLAGVGAGVYSTQEPSPASVVVRSNVEGAQVFLNGKPHGKLASKTLKLENLAPGRHEVELRAKGFRTCKKQVQLGAGAKVSLALEMKK